LCKGGSYCAGPHSKRKLMFAANRRVAHRANLYIDRKSHKRNLCNSCVVMFLPSDQNPTSRSRNLGARPLRAHGSRDQSNHRFWSIPRLPFWHRSWPRILSSLPSDLPDVSIPAITRPPTRLRVRIPTSFVQLPPSMGTQPGSRDWDGSDRAQRMGACHACETPNGSRAK